MHERLWCVACVVSFLGAVPGCDRSKSHRSTHPNGRTMEEYRYRIAPDGDTLVEGHYQRFYASGGKAEEGWFVDGKKDSLWRCWDSITGDKTLEETWRVGVLHGEHWRLERSSSEYSQGVYANGRKEGKWKEALVIDGRNAGWHEGCYRNDLREGVWVEHPIEGRSVKYVNHGLYHRGVKHGVWLRRHALGGRWSLAHCERDVYEFGRLVQTATPCGDSARAVVVNAEGCE